MAYHLHIERPGETPASEPIPIPLQDWRAAVEATSGVRLFAGEAHIGTAPTTNHVIRISAGKGDAEVFFADDGRWYPVFHWLEGSIAFKASVQPGDTSHPVWTAAVELASHLDAVIRGDDGELYDLQTGQMRGG